MMNKYTEIIKSKAFQVEFIKKNGEKRLMVASCHPEVISKILGERKISERKKNDEVCVVMDLQKQEFRSFRWDSVVNMKKLR